jgi:hypothetical protein
MTANKLTLIREILSYSSFEKRKASFSEGEFYSLSEFIDLVPPDFLKLGDIHQGGAHGEFSVLEHTIRKLNKVAETLAVNAEGYSEKEIEYLLQAALWHDYGKIDPRSKEIRHEDISADYAVNILPLMGYTIQEVELISHMIRTEDTFGIVSYYMETENPQVTIPEEKVKLVKDKYAEKYIHTIRNDNLGVSLERLIDYSTTLCHSDVLSIPGIMDKAPNIYLIKRGMLEYLRGTS